MGDSPPRQGHESQQRQPPSPPKSAIIQIFYGFIAGFHERQRKSEKREAQRDRNETRLAYWTRIVGIFTFGLSVIGVGTVCILWKTDQTARDINRAFVFLRDISLGAIAEDGETRWLTVPIWENGGNTPTRDMKSKISVLVAPIKFPDGISRCDFNARAAPVPIVLGPKATSKVRFFEMPSKMISQFQDTKGIKTFYVWGWATYRDVFSDSERITRFCLDVSHVIGNPNDASTDIRLSYGLCSEGNCTDDECKKEDERLSRLLPAKDFCETLNAP
jgi:hypothetical protein